MSNAAIGHGHGNEHSTSHSTNTTHGGGNTIVGVGGALSFMGCVRDVREASPPPPHDDHRHTLVMDDFDLHCPENTILKKPKKRRFHPLRGLRRMFRRKSRSTADTSINSRMGEQDSDLMTNNREELTVRHPAGSADEIRSKSASELLTDASQRQSVFLRRGRADGSTISKRRGASGQLSVSHDSIFPGEVPHARPLSDLITCTALEQSQQENTSDDSIRNDYTSGGFYNHLILLDVLEQIKTAIENRHHTTSTESNHVSHNFLIHDCKQDKSKETNTDKNKVDNEQRWTIAQTLQQDDVDKVSVLSKADLQCEGPSLNHTAAHHRISVRPKNRRPPRRTINIINNISSSTITSISENADILDSLEPIANTDTSNECFNQITEIKNSPMINKSARQLSKSSDIFHELETKLPKKSASIASLSPDSLDLSTRKIMIDNNLIENNFDMIYVCNKLPERISKNSRDKLDIIETTKMKKSSPILINKYDKMDENNMVNSFSKSSEAFINKLVEDNEVTSIPEKIPNFISKSTDGFDKLLVQSESKPILRRLASKSIDTFDNINDPLDLMSREKRHHHKFKQHTNKTHSVSKSSDSLETTNTPLISNDSIEQRSSDFEFHPRRNIKAMSMSSENFDIIDKSQRLEKRNSVTDVHLSSITRHSKMMNQPISKSTESFDTIMKNFDEKKSECVSNAVKQYWRISHRTNNSQSSDNLDLEGNVETQKILKPTKKTPTCNVVDKLSDSDDIYDDSGKSLMSRMKLSRFQKTSDNSEVTSVHTPDSNKQNNLFDNTKTIDTLENNLDNNGKYEEFNKNASKLTINQNESDTTNANNGNNESNGDNEENTTLLVSPDKSFWRQKSELKENIDIHQLLAITIVSRVTDNSNNPPGSVSFPRKKPASLPTSPIVKQEDNKLLFNNFLVNKNDEELQNMLNGNISEVSTDTKSFKEKLIMFEKLGK